MADLFFLLILLALFALGEGLIRACTRFWRKVWCDNVWPRSRRTDCARPAALFRFRADPPGTLL